jgi:hypothetical protein
LLDLFFELFSTDLMLHDLVHNQIGDNSCLDIAETVVGKHWFEKHVHDLLILIKKSQETALVFELT